MDRTRRKLLKSSAAFAFYPLMANTLIPANRAAAQEFTPKYTLDVQETGGWFNKGMAYNAVYPGPVMRVKPGEALNVRLVNSLPVRNDDCTNNMNSEHGLNTTNLHPHGLHVSPSFDSSGQYFSDNVFVSLVPEGQEVECAHDGHEGHGDMAMEYVWGAANYRFELPDTHMTGTFWYHAHKHGSTAHQVGAGLAGPLIVEDVPGTMPTYIEEAEERILFLGNDGLVLVNEVGGGTENPTLEMAPGSVHRLRIINGMGNGRNMHIPRLSLAGLEAYLIAFDGFTLDTRVPIDLENVDRPWRNPAALSSGNRLDLIVHVPKDYVETQNEDQPTGRANVVRIFDIDIAITGAPVDMVWSTEDALPGAGLVPFGDAQLPERSVAFTRGNTIDGAAFDGDIEQTMTLGTEEDWTVTNSTGQLHVYHIHVNPFFITHLDGEALPEGSPLRRWQDTVATPLADGRTPGEVKFKTRFEKFTGRFVIHCHVLAHEDAGMMQIVEVVDG